MQAETYKTAIVLINYNGIADTNACIESIRQTTAPLPFIIVVENCSKDAAIIEKELVAYPHLKLIKSKQNIGFGRANNLAINWLKENINCSYVYILNNDTIVTPGHIETLAEELAGTGPQVALTTPKIMVYSNPEEVWYKGGLIDFNKMSAVIEGYEPPETDKPYITDFATGCAMFFKASILYKLGGFDPFYFMYDEDVELSINIKESGFETLCVPSTLLYHKCQGSQLTKQDDIPTNQLHPAHPSLIFYLNNTIVNRRYTLKKHLKKNKLKVYLKFNAYWLAKACQYLLHAKIKAFSTTVACLVKPFKTNAAFKP